MDGFAQITSLRMDAGTGLLVLSDA
jgi:hypothetical protein